MTWKVILVSGEPKPGHEANYRLAMKHRWVAMELMNATPWWSFRKARRRRDMWARAMRRFHQHGRDREVVV